MQLLHVYGPGLVMPEQSVARRHYTYFGVEAGRGEIQIFTDQEVEYLVYKGVFD